jgi:hypothetical protein
MDESKETLLSGQNQEDILSNLESSFSEASLDSTSSNSGVVPKQTLKLPRWSIYFFATSIFLFLIYLSLSLGHSRVQIRPSEWAHCGNTTIEARTNGCILDFIAGAWVPPACYDSELEAEFLSLSEWHWFADAAGAEELSFEFIKETGGPNPIYVSTEYHRQHCAYTWLKLHRAVILHVPIDTHIGGYLHSRHCSRGLAKPDPPPPSRFYEIFTECKMPRDCKFEHCFTSTRHISDVMLSWFEG